ncbi:MAG: ABC-F family ATP-binding cassette domain-containing protein [Candidatus Omnitrophica bacterium]|nr:ABC-F family ATP-binding cassette domain-containing protein [Candidatus Omnitrophota bacterium]MDD5429629.1 ABC-F family ATP-binding cassette domain-containing protein [Candidatus Omnitrophota bacterium]
MISINNISKHYGGRVLFEKVSQHINRGEKIGLIGPNGAGKSTFLSILLGKTEQSSGNIQFTKNIRIGYLPQEISFPSNASVIGEVTGGDDTISRLKKEKERLESEHKAGLSQYGDVLHQLEFLGYFELEHKAKKVLSGLGFKEKDFSRPVSELSGGWQMRVLLAKLLVCQYDVLFLDEPMNHLDLGAALWFKDYLNAYKGAFVMISHDKDFLNEVANCTLVLENGQITKVSGNYDEYRKILDEKRRFLIKKFNEQEKKIEQLKVFISRFHAQPNKASQVRAKKRVLEKMEKIIVPQDRRESIRNFSFPVLARSGQQVVKLEEVSKSYGDIIVYKDFDFEITRGQRAVLVGENGAGKSTLLKILAGVIPVDEGRRVLGHNTDVGYFSQTRMDTLSSDNTVLQEAYSASGGRLSIENIRTILAVFLFIGDDIEKKVTVLSGGEKSRLLLAKLLINPPNFLLLDEPTTHLDVDAVDALIQALSVYQGTLVFISHDIHFVRSIANIVFAVKGGTVKKFPGNFDYYWQKNKNGQLPTESGISSKKVSSGSYVASIHKKKTIDSKSRKQHNDNISKQIRELRKNKEKLELDRNVKARVLANPRSYHNKEIVSEYGRKIKDLEKNISDIEREITSLKNLFE